MKYKVDISNTKPRIYDIWESECLPYFEKKGFICGKDLKWKTDTLLFKDEEEAIMFRLKFGV
jgi:hypothetical protein